MDDRNAEQLLYVDATLTEMNQLAARGGQAYRAALTRGRAGAGVAPLALLHRGHTAFGGGLSYLPQAPAARRSASATSAAPSRTALPRSNRIWFSALTACCHRSCSAW